MLIREALKIFTMSSVSTRAPSRWRNPRRAGHDPHSFPQIRKSRSTNPSKSRRRL